MVRVDQVPLWAAIGGIGHAVEYRTVVDCEPAWTRTLCGQIGNFRDFGEVVPSRICRGCRVRLAGATLSDGVVKGGGP